MATTPAALRPVLLGACAALLLGGVAGLAVVDRGDGDERELAVQEPSTTSTAPPATLPAVPGAGPGEPTSTVPGAPSTTGAASLGGGPSSTATTAAAGPATTRTTTTAAPGAPPGPLTPPAPGAYAYDARTTEAGKEPRTERIATQVEAAGTEGGATVQEITIVTEGPQGRVSIRSNIAWSGAGAIVRRSVITAGSQQLDCAWKPSWAQYAGGLKVGTTWSFDTACTATTTFGPVTIRQQSARKVVGQKPDALPGGGTVATWTVEEDSTQTLTFGGTTATTRTTGTEQLAPSLGLPTSSQRRTVSSSGGTTTTNDVETRLVQRP